MPDSCIMLYMSMSADIQFVDPLLPAAEVSLIPPFPVPELAILMLPLQTRPTGPEGLPLSTAKEVLILHYGHPCSSALPLLLLLKVQGLQLHASYGLLRLASNHST